MPRRRGGELSLVLEVENGPVCDYLKDEFLRLKAVAKETVDECPICLECACKKCYLLLRCGHGVCAACWCKVDEKVCPLCKK